MTNIDQGRVTYFPEAIIKDTPLPERFTFPFYYEPHPLTKLAAAELQHFLETQTHLDHNFGLMPEEKLGAIGKMFGVLVVADTEGRIGYLSAFSGKLADSNSHAVFVPPVFDMLAENSFFLQEQEVISAINTQIEELSADVHLHNLKKQLEECTTQATEEIAALKLLLKVNKEQRRVRREELKSTIGEQEYEVAEADLAKQSHYDRHQLRLLKAKWDQQLQELLSILTPREERLEVLKNERRERSGALQLRLFEQYSFLNKDGMRKSLYDIFTPTVFGSPPSGAGECATPKLLQYAFAHGYKPLAMAEFWWGASPASEIRKHKQFYPACTGKCKPILAHMLEGVPMDDNPLLQPTDERAQLAIIYEDEYLMVVNKPEGLRSVPGVAIEDSVYSRLKYSMPDIELHMVHRLDLGTSGLLVVAKSPSMHKHLQKQFLARTISKRYTALLSKKLDMGEGEISLPLTGDPYNRPMQLVCFETGKTSITRWKVVSTNGHTTKIHFWPLTGRSHQLRMHAAHALGLNAPIVGDDLYGTPAERLYLHAAYLSFVHPKTKETLSFEVEEDF